MSGKGPFTFPLELGPSEDEFFSSCRFPAASQFWTPKEPELVGVKNELEDYGSYLRLLADHLEQVSKLQATPKRVLRVPGACSTRLPPGYECVMLFSS